MLSPAAIDRLIKLRNYCDVLVEAQGILEEPPPKKAAEPDLEAWGISQRNRVLANSGDKAELLGTLTQPPLVTLKELTGLQLETGLAEEMLAARDEIRAQAAATGKLWTF